MSPASSIPEGPRDRARPAREPAVHDSGSGEGSTGHTTLHRSFEAQADARSEAVAVVFGDGRTTYGALEASANRIARYLRRRGMGRGSRVALLLPRSPDCYAAVLGTLKAGACYVPLDPAYPPDRIRYILDDSAADVLVTTTELAERAGPFGGVTIRVDGERTTLAAESSERLRRDVVGVGPRDLCYIIYTSGSTGRPKGVMVEHRNACHLVSAEARLFKVHRDDRVFQGARLTFDLSVEEMWLAWRAGATLVAATPGMMQAGPDLPRLLTAQGVTVLSTVPTLLAMLDGDLPTVRLLVLGGEECPDHLAWRWATPRRRVVNTYGPTEATVIATYAEVTPDAPVTLGRAVPGYRVHLLDDRLRPVPPGTVGEICIGGAGVARGYVGLPELTCERFVPDPFAEPETAPGRIYRTGDLGRLNADGNIEFLGRADDQVKLRGFRIELREIEAALAEDEAVLSAACTVREDVAGVRRIIGYVVPKEGRSPDERTLRGRIARRVPPYMVPAAIEALARLPVLPSGKLDRSALPAPRRRSDAPKEAVDPPRTDTERAIARVWRSLFDDRPVSLSDHFFEGLGGHSLLAARAVSELRQDPRFASLSVVDLYEHPTVASLAAAVEAGASPQRPRPPADPDTLDATLPAAPPEGEAGLRRRHFIAGLVQGASLPLVLSIRGAQWVTPYLVFFLLLATGQPVGRAVAWMVVSAALVLPVAVLLAIAVKWSLLGRVKAGRHALWSWYHLRWWFAHSVVEAAPLQRLSGTPLLPFIYRLLGARVGRDVHLASNSLAAFDLISIGDGASVDEGASLLGYVVEDGELIVGSVRVGSDAFLGLRAVLGVDVVLEDGARLEDLSMLSHGGRIPAGETWGGSPARRAPRRHPAPPSRPERGALRSAAATALYVIMTLLFPLVGLIAFAPGIVILSDLEFFSVGFMLAAPLVGASFVLLVAMQVVLLKWLLVGHVRPGTYAVHGRFYIRHWVVDQLLALGVEVLGPLHATLYVAPWYRALGARIERFVELSTATSTIPDLLHVEEGSTIADEVSLGAPRVEGGWMTLAPTRIGRRAFVGNSGVVPAGTTLGDRSLIGVLSIVPADRRETARPDAGWLGSPPIRLARRQASAAFPDARTFLPTPSLRLARGSFELLRVTLPAAGFIFVAVAVIEGTLALWAHAGPVTALLGLPLVHTAACLGIVAGVAVAKWIVIGRYRPFERPLWSLFVWRLEFVNALYEFLAAPLVLESLQGTPFLPWYLRLLGARIGRRTHMETTGFLEWDLVEIGDGVVLNEGCVMQTHLFEDRVLKASRLRLGDRCEVGVRSVVLYDSDMGDGARLEGVSLLMKGETLPPDTAWAGSPLATSRPTPPAPTGDREPRVQRRGAVA